MAVRIRMKRTGRRNRPFYRVEAFDSRTPRDGKCLESLGTYDPLEDDLEKQLIVKQDRVEHWVNHGAKASETVATLLKKRGITVPR